MTPNTFTYRPRTREEFQQRIDSYKKDEVVELVSVILYWLRTNLKLSMPDTTFGFFAVRVSHAKDCLVLIAADAIIDRNTIVEVLKRPPRKPRPEEKKKRYLQPDTEIIECCAPKKGRKNYLLEKLRKSGSSWFEFNLELFRPEIAHNRSRVQAARLAAKNLRLRVEEEEAIAEQNRQACLNAQLQREAAERLIPKQQFWCSKCGQLRDLDMNRGLFNQLVCGHWA
jgi:hypothetical protein